MTRPLISLLLLVSFASACRAAERAEDHDRIVAHMEGRAIRHSEIRCPRTMAQDVRRCAEVESAQLQKIVLRRLVEIAASRQGIVLTEQDVLKTIPPQLLDEKVLNVAARRWKLVARAVLDVRNGGDANVIFREQLQPQGITRAELDSALSLYSDEDARRAASADLVAETRQRVIRDYTYRERVKRLRQAIERTAGEKNQSYDAAAAALWADVLRDAQLVIDDPRYAMPELKGFP